jgi:hypothetical protein
MKISTLGEKLLEYRKNDVVNSISLLRLLGIGISELQSELHL